MPTSFVLREGFRTPAPTHASTGPFPLQRASHLQLLHEVSCHTSSSSVHPYPPTPYRTPFRPPRVSGLIHLQEGLYHAYSPPAPHANPHFYDPRSCRRVPPTCSNSRWGYATPPLYRQTHANLRLYQQLSFFPPLALACGTPGETYRAPVSPVYPHLHVFLRRTHATRILLYLHCHAVVPHLSLSIFIYFYYFVIFYSRTYTDRGSMAASRPVSQPPPPRRDRPFPFVSLTTGHTPHPTPLAPPAAGARTLTHSAVSFPLCSYRLLHSAAFHPLSLLLLPSSSSFLCRPSKIYQCRRSYRIRSRS